MIEDIDVGLDAFKVLKNLSRIGSKYENSMMAVEFCGGGSVKLHLRKGTRNILKSI